MKTNIATFATLIFFLLIMADHAFAKNELLPVVYVTFEEYDTSRSLTINYHSDGTSKNSEVMYGTKSCEGVKECSYFSSQTGTTSHLKGIQKTFHHVKLTGLTPATTYYFVVGNSESGYSNEYKVKTLPDDDTPVLLVNGGDMGTSSVIPQVAAEAISEEPQALLLGGDISYANGQLRQYPLWEEWFKLMMQTWISPSGYLIPIIVAIGNHEVTTAMYTPGADAPFYKAFFPQSHKSYFVRRLGGDSVLMVLDSGHLAFHHGEQKEWLEGELKRHQGLKNRLAIYHIPLYPSNRSYWGLFSQNGRNHWGPLFDKYQLTLAMEHHDHTLKRTKVLKNEKEAEKGTVFIGDGCFGKNARAAKERKYLEISESERHVWSILINGNTMSIKATGDKGRRLDQFTLINTNERTLVY